MTYILVLFAHVGMMGDGNSNSLAMHQFSSEQTCKVAGEAARKLSMGSTKEITFVCVKQ